MTSGPRERLEPESVALVELGRALERASYRFVTVTPQTHARVLARAARRGQLQARTLRDVFGWNMPFARDLLPSDMVAWLDRAGVLEPAGDLLRARIRYSTVERALFVHSAFPTDAPDAVFFGPDTYRFCSFVRRAAPLARRIADVGCGTGAGGLALAGRDPERLVLADVNSQALRFAGVNVALAGASAELVESDLLRGADGEFDLIVANPPYMQDPGARQYRHGGGELGEALSLRIVREVLPRLAAGGTLLLYTGAAIVGGEDVFERGVRPLLAADGRVRRVDYEELDPDVFGEELDTPAYAAVDRIAAVGLAVHVV